MPQSFLSPTSSGIGGNALHNVLSSHSGWTGDLSKSLAENPVIQLFTGFYPEPKSVASNGEQTPAPKAPSGAGRLSLSSDESFDEVSSSSSTEKSAPVVGTESGAGLRANHHKIYEPISGNYEPVSKRIVIWKSADGRNQVTIVPQSKLEDTDKIWLDSFNQKGVTERGNLFWPHRSWFDPIEPGHSVVTATSSKIDHKTKKPLRHPETGHPLTIVEAAATISLRDAIGEDGRSIKQVIFSYIDGWMGKGDDPGGLARLYSAVRGWREENGYELSNAPFNYPGDETLQYAYKRLISGKLSVGKWQLYRAADEALRRGIYSPYTANAMSIHQERFNRAYEQYLKKQFEDEYSRYNPLSLPKEVYRKKHAWLEWSKMVSLSNAAKPPPIKPNHH